MARVAFRVSARAARLIGRENVATAHGAVTELVKNAYDADAGACAVLFVPRWPEMPESFSDQEISAVGLPAGGQHEVVEQRAGRWHPKPDASGPAALALRQAVARVLDLWIVDNGHGMSAETIDTRWMVIGTDAKELNARSSGGRVVTGAKGIGRFALDRLGRESDLFSGQAGADGIVHWFVDWADFEGTGKIVSDVEALLERESQSLEEVYSASPIVGLLPTHRPGRGAAAPEPLSFATGTAIRVGLLTDPWTVAEVQRLKESLASLLPPQDRADFEIFVHDHRNPENSGFIDNLPPDQFDYRMIANVFDTGKVTIRLDRQEIEAGKIRSSTFLNPAMQQPGFAKEDFEKGYAEFETDLQELLGLSSEQDVARYRAVGPFSFTLYFFKLQNANAENLARYPQRNFDVSRRRDWLRNSGGIRLYRDHFRVRPFGEPGSQAYDWLLLGEKVARNPVAASRIGWSVPPQQVAGTLYITKHGNPDLDDQSNREGIRNERAFQAFREIVTALIGRFEHDRSYILHQFGLAYDADNPEPIAVQEALRLVKEFRRGSRDDPAGSGDGQRADREGAANEPENGSMSDALTKVGKALEASVEKSAAVQDDMQLLRGMATLGTILVSFTHELKQIKADVESRGDRLAKAVASASDPERVARMPDPARPLSIVDRMRRQDEKVSRWVDFALSAVSPAKRRRHPINVRDYLLGVEGYWTEFLTERGIQLHRARNPVENAHVLAHEIDLDCILYNLINNSVEAFLQPSEQKSREIWMELESQPGAVDIIYKDNGPGLSTQFNVPDDIFLFGETSKRDNGTGEPGGTGLGMWLLRNVVDDYRGSVDLRSRQGMAGFEIWVRLPTHGPAEEAVHDR